MLCGGRARSPCRWERGRLQRMCEMRDTCETHYSMSKCWKSYFSQKVCVRREMRSSAISRWKVIRTPYAVTASTAAKIAEQEHDSQSKCKINPKTTRSPAPVHHFFFSLLVSLSANPNRTNDEKKNDRNFFIVVVGFNVTAWKYKKKNSEKIK